MHNHEIEKLARKYAYEYLGINPKAKSLQARDAQDVNIFEAGYLKGVDNSKFKDCLDIAIEYLEKIKSTDIQINENTIEMTCYSVWARQALKEIEQLLSTKGEKNGTK